MHKKCLKCGHVNSNEQVGELDGCPQCGAIYSKVEAQAKREILGSNNENFAVIDSDPIMLNSKKIIGIVLVCLVAGYMAGREHIKYEIRNALTPLAAIAGVFSDKSTKEEHREAETRVPGKAGWFEAEPIVSATLIDKIFSPSDSSRSEFNSYLNFKIKFENKEDKNIRAFQGIVGLFDLLDDKIMSLRISINEPIAANSSIEWDGQTEYNRFKASDKKARGAELKNIKTTFQPTKILYEDGTTKEFN